MPISVVFDPPLPSDSPSTFNTKAFTLLGDLNDWSTQANALPGEVDTNLSALLAAPPAIGSTTPAAVSATTLSASGNISLTSAANADLTLTRAAYSNYSMISFNTVAGQSWGVGSRTSGVTPSDSFSIYSSTYGGNALSITNAGAVTIPGSVSTGTLTTAAGVGSTVSNPFDTPNVILKTVNSTVGNYSAIQNFNYAGAANAAILFVNDGQSAYPNNGGSIAFATYAGGGAAGTVKMTIAANGDTTFNSGTFGYGTGAGGTVTQATSKSTAVTLNKPCGQITMNNAALAAGAEVQFAVNNTFAVPGGMAVACQHDSAIDTQRYQVRVAALWSGAFAISVKNLSGVSQSDALVINFQVHSGATS